MASGSCVRPTSVENRPTPLGGTYREAWRYVDDGCELVLRCEHDVLPVAFETELRTLRTIDQPAVGVTRARFRRWAEAR